MDRALLKTAAILLAGTLLANGAGWRAPAPPMPTHPPFEIAAGVASPDLDLLPARLQTDSAFLDQLARDTWAYLSSDWATAHHLPWSWRSEHLSGGGHANPAEIGLYALAWLAAYDFQRPWSPTWPQAEAQVTAILDQLRAWQTGSQAEQPYGPNAYRNSLFYQWYWISYSPPMVGANPVDHVVPSIDNAWLAASLLTIREYGLAHHRPALAQKAGAVLADMDFTPWYHPATHRFFLGGPEDPQGGHVADYYSNENRLVNFVARALGQLSVDEFRLSLAALDRPAGSYAGIDVEALAWDGSYFTYTAPALFIREVETAYGANTILPATQAQIAYADQQGYAGWGFSDCFGAGAGGYLQQGAPPVAMPGSPEASPGLVAPYAGALALITPLSSQANTNLQDLSSDFSCAYHPEYGFRDALVVDPASPDYGKCSQRFSALAQEWIFLAIANHQNGFIWDYFYREAGVLAAHRDMFADYRLYLPVALKPLPPLVPAAHRDYFADYKLYLPVALKPLPPLVVADFDNCAPLNNLGGEMGAAFNPPDHLADAFVPEPGRGCVAELAYNIVNWSAFWLKLPGVDLTPYGRLVFDIRAAQPGLPAEIKIELKRAGGHEVSHVYVSGLTEAWQTIQVDLADFGPVDYAPPLSSWLGIEELVFTFEAGRSGDQGVVYLDNVAFWPGAGPQSISQAK